MWGFQQCTSKQCFDISNSKNNLKIRALFIFAFLWDFQRNDFAFFFILGSSHFSHRIWIFYCYDESRKSCYPFASFTFLCLFQICNLGKHLGSESIFLFSYENMKFSVIDSQKFDFQFYPMLTSDKQIRNIFFFKVIIINMIPEL